jgi:F-type H+-transporting ATPase subunit delta
MTGARAEIVTAVDPDLIGGVTVRIGDRLIDASVRGRLERLRDHIVAGAR